ncbi:MAG: alkaline phosphatase [Candidatus Cryptobacteroides sp.]
MNKFFFKSAAAVLIMMATLPSLTSCNACKEEKTPKYVFLFIGDGMGLAHVAATDSFLAYQDSCYGGSYLSFTSFPVTGLTRTWCANTGVTDSAAAGTALACGQKTEKGRLGTAPDGSALKSIAYSLKEQGYQVGIMSDGPVNHATPGAFFAHAQGRNDYYNIALEMKDCGFEFLGGSEIIDRFGKKNDREDVVGLIEADGNTDVCFGLAELSASTASTRILLPENPEASNDFDAADSNKNYDLAMAGLGMQTADFVSACLETLDTDKPFFIMAEQGYIDWSSHGNNTMRVIESVKLLDKAVRLAYEFYLKHPDETLIVVTSDHETGGMSFGTRKYMTNWQVLDEFWESSGHDDSGLTKEQLKQLNEDAYVGWSSHDHTGCPVPVYAIGKNAERLTGFYENCDLPLRILGEK